MAFEFLLSWNESKVIRRAAEMRSNDAGPAEMTIRCELAESKLLGRYEGPNPLDPEAGEKLASELSENYSLWGDIDRICESLRDAFDSAPEGQAGAWGRPPLAWLRACHHDHKVAIMDYLEAAAAAYLKSGLRSKSAELLLARHLAFTEAHALGLLIGYPAAKIGVVDVLKLGGSAVLGLIQLGAAISIGQSHGVGVGILALSLMVTASSLYRRNKIDAKIADAMRYEHLLKVCNVLNREAPSPAEVTSLMDAGASKLCVWPDGLRSIVEVALSRNRALWS